MRENRGGVMKSGREGGGDGEERKKRKDDDGREFVRRSQNWS